MININNLTKKYNEGTLSEHSIIDNAFLNVIKGEKIIIIGENGVGKTTLLKIIGLLDRNFSGEYLINNTNISTMSTNQIAKLRNEVFGFIFQEYNLLEEEAAYDNILIPLLYSEKYKRRERKERINDISEALEIQNILEQKVKYLSGGERQRVAIARAVINDPEVIILDEPTNALNPRMKIKTLNYIENLAKNKILILVTHDMSIIDKSNYNCYELKNGKITKPVY